MKWCIKGSGTVSMGTFNKRCVGLYLQSVTGNYRGSSVDGVVPQWDRTQRNALKFTSRRLAEGFAAEIGDDAKVWRVLSRDDVKARERKKALKKALQEVDRYLWESTQEKRNVADFLTLLIKNGGEL